MSSWVLDASALLALLNGESGSERVAEVLPEAAIASVNFSEVVAKLADEGRDEAEIRSYLDLLGLEIVEFDAELAYRTGFLRPLTRSLGLSLGDRACLALASFLQVPALTCDRAWTSLNLEISVELIR
ncbi:type II toxin-antitoxin system VapC family toxin [Leptolyngbya sp. AN03gr2]|uniref:type II toxin-antitoxin system VapC family toxin n=1 Tax=unclassified Leptolyngbya TaxID=2650499 RepID=UPI003D3146C3